ncbi:MAG: hypothetical protein LGB53_07360 [Sulfurovum sp.]|nr:hypothetical protein [Sulfurovum sp.]
MGYVNVIKDLAAGLLVVRNSQFTVQGDTGSILQMDINGKRGQSKNKDHYISELDFPILLTELKEYYRR